MFNQNISSNKFDLNLSKNAFFILVYSDFYEIPLPALRFEKVEETDTIKWKNDTEENNAFQIDHVNIQEEADAWDRKAEIHSPETTRRGQTQQR